MYLLSVNRFRCNVMLGVTTKNLIISVVCISMMLFNIGMSNANGHQKGDGPSIVIELPLSTQGPLWPPSELANKNGDFVVIGTLLEENENGGVAIVPGQAIIVSKDTIPPLDSSGREDFSNPFAAPYKVKRHLDLSQGSKDLEMELYSLSVGPYSGDFGGGARIPKQGESQYNLNGTELSCPEIFPASSQSKDFIRPGFPLHQVPIWGFQGDQVQYDADTYSPSDPFNGTGANCPESGCSGENLVTPRRTKAITLGEYIKARGKVKITLTRYSVSQQEYTAARLDFTFRKLLPNSVSTIWGIRANNMFPMPKVQLPSPLAIPNIIIADNKGNARFSVELKNPFPDPSIDDKGLRVMALALSLHSDMNPWGGCASLLGGGVDTHTLFVAAPGGPLGLTDLITVDSE